MTLIVTAAFIMQSFWIYELWITRPPFMFGRAFCQNKVQSNKARMKVVERLEIKNDPPSSSGGLLPIG